MIGSGSEKGEKHQRKLNQSLKKLKKEACINVFFYPFFKSRGSLKLQTFTQTTGRSRSPPTVLQMLRANTTSNIWLQEAAPYNECFCCIFSSIFMNL